jgi:hypothetical protein
MEVVISTAERGWQQKAVRSMRARQRFVLETSCPSFDPSDTTLRALPAWLRGSGTGMNRCDLPGAFGIILVGCSLMVPERITRGSLAVLGLVGILCVGHLMLRILVSRYTYRWRVSFNQERRKYSWLAEPME